MTQEESKTGKIIANSMMELTKTDFDKLTMNIVFAEGTKREFFRKMKFYFPLVLVIEAVIFLMLRPLMVSSDVLIISISGLPQKTFEVLVGAVDLITKYQFLIVPGMILLFIASGANLLKSKI